MRDNILNYFQGNFKSFYAKYFQNIKVLSGDECQVLCPFHDDHKPSFNFNIQNGQYFCHGCRKKGDIFHFYGKINSLDTKRDFEKILRGMAKDFGIPWESEQKRIVKTYDYIDANGKQLFQVCRMEPKDFRQRHRNGNDWVWNLKGIKRVLYRLQDVLKAKEVIIVEGEKDVDTLTDMGFIATTSPMGAKKWRDEYNEALKDKDIILIPDNDNEGREHMIRIAISLNGIVKSLKWCRKPN